MKQTYTHCIEEERWCFQNILWMWYSSQHPLCVERYFELREKVRNDDTDGLSDDLCHHSNVLMTPSLRVHFAMSITSLCLEGAMYNVSHRMSWSWMRQNITFSLLLLSNNTTFRISQFCSFHYLVALEFTLQLLSSSWLFSQHNICLTTWRHGSLLLPLFREK